jgi:hypothetical protein
MTILENSNLFFFICAMKCYTSGFSNAVHTINELQTDLNYFYVDKYEKIEKLFSLNKDGIENEEIKNYKLEIKNNEKRIKFFNEFPLEKIEGIIRLHIEIPGLIDSNPISTLKELNINGKKINQLLITINLQNIHTLFNENHYFTKFLKKIFKSYSFNKNQNYDSEGWVLNKNGKRNKSPLLKIS